MFLAYLQGMILFVTCMFVGPSPMKMPFGAGAIENRTFIGLPMNPTTDVKKKWHDRG